MRGSPTKPSTILQRLVTPSHPPLFTSPLYFYDTERQRAGHNQMTTEPRWVNQRCASLSLRGESPRQYTAQSWVAKKTKTEVPRTNDNDSRFLI